MRTTIEISDYQRSFLAALAAQRGLRGYSEIVREALDLYIAKNTEGSDLKERVLSMRGSWSGGDADRTRSRLAELRKEWNME